MNRSHSFKGGIIIVNTFFPREIVTQGNGIRTCFVHNGLVLLLKIGCETKKKVTLEMSAHESKSYGECIGYHGIYLSNLITIR